MGKRLAVDPPPSSMRRCKDLAWTNDLNQNAPNERRSETNLVMLILGQTCFTPTPRGNR